MQSRRDACFCGSGLGYTRSTSTKGEAVNEDQAKGKAKQAEGEAQETWGDAKDKAGDAMEDIKDKANDLKDEAGDMLDRDEEDKAEQGTRSY